jgi:hypothetical protein
LACCWRSAPAKSPTAPAASPAAKAAPAAPAAAPKKLSEEFSYSTYKASAGEYTMLVYSWVALWRKDEAYIPIVVAVGRGDEKHVKGESKEQKEAGRKAAIIKVTDFVLTDSQGKTYPTTPFEEILDKYKYLPDDKDMLMQDPMVTNGAFPDAAPMSVAFYPTTGGARMMSNATEIDNYSAFMSTIYFANPGPAGLTGILTVTLSNPEVTPPVVVNFKLPEEKEKEKHKKKE